MINTRLAMLTPDQAAKCISYKVAHSLAELHLERPVDMMVSQKLAHKANYSSFLITFDQFKRVCPEVTEIIVHVMHLAAQSSNGFRLVATIKETDMVEWIQEANSRWALVVNKTVRMHPKTPKKNLYEAYLTVKFMHHTLMHKVTQGKGKHAKTVAEFEVHKEQCLSIKEMLKHGEVLVSSLQLLGGALIE
jgi:hypothetical protein